MSDLDTSLTDLVDWRAGRISGRVFADEDIYAREGERLFLRSWLYLAHESQLRTTGDFVTTFVGADPVVVVRQADGSIRAMLNACRHRGMKVCRVDAGHANRFTCPFHGWSYDPAGTLVHVPLADSAYHGELDTSAWGLVAMPRVASYKGLVFGCFDPDVAPLLEYLGEMAWYLDCLLDRREGGTEVLGGVHKIRMRGNWKLVAEQFAGDNYHASFAHLSAPAAWADAAAPPPRFGASMRAEGRQFSCREGHGTAGFFLGSRALTAALRTMSDDHRVVADYYDATDAEVARRLGVERSRGPSSTAGCVFPNLVYLAAVFGNSTLGVVHPKGPDRFELWRWGVVDVAAPPEVKAAMRRCLQVWPLGLADADDGESWSGIQEAMAGPMVRRQSYNYQMGLGHAGPDDVYPGVITAQPLGDEPQRAFYRRWLEFMTSDEWPRLR